DHIFVERAAALSSGWKLRGGTQKYILKKLAERAGVPPEVIHRPKRGFALPLVHWLRHELKEELAQLLLEPRTLARGYFNPRAVQQLLNEHNTGRRDQSALIWMLLVFELWHRNFLEAPRAREAQSAALASS
ncbi:MAG: asparagine synthase-related protein, partial [Terriglobia bacterium]